MFQSLRILDLVDRYLNLVATADAQLWGFLGRDPRTFVTYIPRMRSFGIGHGVLAKWFFCWFYMLIQNLLHTCVRLYVPKDSGRSFLVIACMLANHVFSLLLRFRAFQPFLQPCTAVSERTIFQITLIPWQPPPKSCMEKTNMPSILCENHSPFLDPENHQKTPFFVRIMTQHVTAWRYTLFDFIFLFYALDYPYAQCLIRNPRPV